MNEVKFSQWKSILFDAGEWACSAVDATGTACMVVERLQPWAAFFSINPLKPGESRKDANVSAHRNFLIEIDNLPLKEQLPLIRKLRCPFASIVYSGAKSLHVIVSLEQPVAHAEWKNTAARLIAAFKHADPTTKNPSRLSRTPYHDRDGGRRQGLVALGSRVSAADLGAWLDNLGVPATFGSVGERLKIVAAQNREHAKELGLSKLPLSARSYRFIRYGAGSGRNHREAMQVAFDAAGAGYTAEETKELLEKANWPTAAPNEIENIVIHVYAKLESTG
jgi:hypothetical protein